MPVDVTLNKTYKLRDRPIHLTLLIGEGQSGTSDIFIDKTRIVRASGTIGRLLVGNGADLAGKALVARSVVNDVSAVTNRMSVTYKLTGGKSNAEFTLPGTVSKSGAALVFEATFDLEA
jgi:hypothetical protein